MSRTLAICLLAACGGTTLEERPGPRGLRADQHLAVASREDQRSDELSHWPDTRSVDNGLQPADQLATGGVWSGRWDTAAEHQRRAAYHRSAAAQLQADYDQLCDGVPPAVASVSPLQRHGIGGSPVDGGTLVLLSGDAGPPDKLLSEMRCHRAWMMLERADMDDCPLDLPGLRIDARGDDRGVQLTMTVADPRLVPELRRRAAHDLEAAASLRSPPR